MAILTHSGTLPDNATKADVYAILDNSIVGGIVNADIHSSAAIVDTKLATISTASKINLTALTLANQTKGDLLYSPDGVSFARLPIGSTGQKLIGGALLDYMEYSTNALAQTGYVTSIPANIISWADTTHAYTGEDGGHEGAYSIDGSYTTYQGVTVTTGNTNITRTAVSTHTFAEASTINTVDYRMYATQTATGSYVRQTSYLMYVQYQTSDLVWHDVPGSRFSGSGGNGTTTYDSTHLTYSTPITDVVAIKAYCASQSEASGGGSGCVVDARIYEIAVTTTTDLLAYSESTLKTQGSYSLKTVAKATNSLNKTLTRTVSPVVDLTSISTIKFDIYASRIGANIKLGIHDSGGTTTEITSTVTTANTWQTVSWDVSGVSTANKDAIDSIVITIVNADADNTFYLDNFYSPNLRWMTP